MPTPEELAREKIDALLEAAGWVLQDNDQFNRNAAQGVAVREFQLPSGPCDYLLFIDGKAAGVIEAKAEGTTLSGVSDQSQKYIVHLPEHLARHGDPLPFAYESTGIETFFRDERDPQPRSRRLFAFHKPATLSKWLRHDETLRYYMQNMPSLDERGLRDCQVEAIHGLETSLANAEPRSLIQMATGAGKTFTACSFSYRLIKYAQAKRILFLVDRNNLGDQTFKEYQQFIPPDDNRHFTDLYITQHLHSNKFDKDAKVVITTIQRLFSMLKGEELDPEEEEQSWFETGYVEEEEKFVEYNPDIPIETFDFIVTDECHRSIYGQWRQVLDYFDAFIIGLTATPSKHTLGFFHQNMVSEYPYERSVADGVNVGFEIFRIKTKVGEEGSQVEAGYSVGVRDKRTRKMRYQELEDDFQYTSKELDRTVTAPNQIRTILQAYKDVLFTELFPGRHEVPKTLIFAKDDNHAEEITHIAREVFETGNDFVKKITYRNTGEKPKEIIKSFRIDYMPRIAVTVDMVATGTDIKPVEVLIFMRDVKSELYYEQMRGRGVRSINPDDLKQVTPDADAKTRFVLIDAVGVTESKKSASQPLERKKNIGFEKLIDQVAQGRRDDDSLSSLAGRLAALDQKIEPEDRAAIEDASGGRSLRDLSNGLLDAIDPDKIHEIATDEHGSTYTDEQAEKIKERLKDEACTPFDDPNLRNILKEIKKKSEIVYDEISTDELTYAGYDLERAQDMVERFKEFIETEKDEILALQILYSQPYRMKELTYTSIQELTEALVRPPWHLDTAAIWQAYKRLETSKVRGAPSEKLLTDIISLIRFATGQDETLEPFSNKVEQRFNLWVGRQMKAGREFSDEQMRWLRLIKDYVAANVDIQPADMQDIPPFSDEGGIIAAKRVFVNDLQSIMSDMKEALVA